MTTFPFVLGYSLERVELTQARELLAQYNDFYAYNLAQYQNYARLQIDDSGEISMQELDPVDVARLEKFGNDNASNFAKLWGSLDFATATLMGLSIDWQPIQVSLFEEQERKIPAVDSGMKETATKLRKVASILSFMDKITNDLKDKKADSEMVALIRQGFEILLAELSTRDIAIPEFNIEKAQYGKIKTVDGIIDYAQKMFALAN